MQNLFLTKDTDRISDPSMIGFIGLPFIDPNGAASPVEHEIRFKPYQERIYQDRGGVL